MTADLSHIQPGLVSVVIANYNGAHHLDDCLSSLAAQTYSPIEIAVVDNGSTDESAEVCRRHGVELVFSGGNNGLASAYNLGVRRCRGEFAFVANNDIWLGPDCIERLVDAMNRHGDRCFATDPKQYNWDQTLIIHYCGGLAPLTRPRQLVNDAFSIFPATVQTYTDTDEETPVPRASAGAMLVRRRLFEEIGGFDDTFFMDAEDTDLCWRANRRGWSSVFVPSAWVRHKWNATNSTLSKKTGNKQSPMGRKLGISQRYNEMRFALKNYDPPNAIGLVTLRISMNLGLSLRGRFSRTSTMFAAVVKIVRTLPAILRQRREIARTAVVSNRELFARFQVGAKQCAQVWPVAHDPVGQNAGAAQRAPKL